MQNKAWNFLDFLQFIYESHERFQTTKLFPTTVLFLNETLKGADFELIAREQAAIRMEHEIIRSHEIPRQSQTLVTENFLSTSVSSAFREYFLAHDQTNQVILRDKGRIKD